MFSTRAFQTRRFHIRGVAGVVGCAAPRGGFARRSLTPARSQSLYVNIIHIYIYIYIYIYICSFVYVCIYMCINACRSP